MRKHSKYRPEKPNRQNSNYSKTGTIILIDKIPRNPIKKSLKINEIDDINKIKSFSYIKTYMSETGMYIIINHT